MPQIPQIKIASSDWQDYELLDSGDRLKLERFGDYIVIRSEPKAWWRAKTPALWKQADAQYFDEIKTQSGWKFLTNKRFPILDFKGIKFATKLLDGSKHLGIFPEQSPHWDYVFEHSQKGKKLLNLFGYTGAASLVAAKAGAEVVHVDASKPSVAWARQNQEISALQDLPIRWIIDDALKFVKRQEKRGELYDAILLDPPAFGRGPKNELWKLEKMLPELLESVSKILSPKTGSYAIITLYSIDASPIMAANIMKDYFKNVELECGELVLNPVNSYPLPLSIWCRAVVK